MAEPGAGDPAWAGDAAEIGRRANGSRERIRMTTAQKATRRLAGDLKSIIRDAEDLLDTTKELTGETVGEVRHRLSSFADSARETYHTLGKKTTATAKATDRCIRGHPYGTVAVFFALGFLIGKWMSRSRN